MTIGSGYSSASYDRHRDSVDFESNEKVNVGVIEFVMPMLVWVT